MIVKSVDAASPGLIVRPPHQERRFWKSKATSEIARINVSWDNRYGCG